MTIENPDKIGLGLWDVDNQGSALNHVNGGAFAWHYNWSQRPLWDADGQPEQSEFVAMLWDEASVTSTALAQLAASGATTLLGFNEPDHLKQANMSVAQALDLWGRLEGTGLRLGSPATTVEGTLGPDSWLGRFMAGVEERGLRVDFVAVHYYSETGDVEEFRAFLEAVHKAYGRPVWVTEWCLADWDHPDRFTPAQQATYARAATEMMDDLPFVERHAWFAGYEGGDGWNLGSGIFGLDGQLTAVGQAFVDLLEPTSEIVGTLLADTLVGTDEGEQIRGEAGADTLLGAGGDDTLLGGSEDDLLDGGAGGDRLDGGGGGDVYVLSDGSDAILELDGGGRDLVRAAVSCILPDFVEELDLNGTLALTGTGNGLANLIKGSAVGNTLIGGAGDDVLLGGTGRDHLYGGTGNDLLGSGGGADRLEGGVGNDTYRINATGDLVIEVSGGGTDRVQSWIGTTLGANLEELQLLGTEVLTGIGNGLANTLIANSGGNTLRGEAGNDTLLGDAGNDWLEGGAGDDLLGSGDGHDRLDGGSGSDALRGGLGDDLFVFTGGRDRILDFQDNGDTLAIDDAVWGNKTRTLQQVLTLATFSNGVVSLDLGRGNSIRLDGLTSVEALRDDLLIV